MAKSAETAYKPISADSHITEPPNCWLDNIEPAYRDRAPHVVTEPKGDTFVVPGIDTRFTVGSIAAAGRDKLSIRRDGAFYEGAVNLQLGGWDPVQRLADQDTDGVAAEIIFPTIGMALNLHPDFDYKRACHQAYNRWMLEFMSVAPERLCGIAQTALGSVEEGIADLTQAKERGFLGVILPPVPGFSDYDDPAYDPLYEVAVDLGLPLCFHVVSARATSVRGWRGNIKNTGKMTRWLTTIRYLQDLAGLFIFGGVFERHPDLRVVLAEADGGWVPHYMYRIDHVYEFHRGYLEFEPMQRLPSDYFKDNIRVTYQDDWSAFDAVRCGLVPESQLMWANEFPHVDATWPDSQELLAKHTQGLTPEAKRAILHDNVASLFGLTV